MERYKKANEGIHAPDELKRNVIGSPSAARKRPPRAAWLGAAAAVLAVVLLVKIYIGVYRARKAKEEERRNA